MIGTLSIKVCAARPNMPLQPVFSFAGSPSSIRILDVPKSIGTWEITSVKLVMDYPDNTKKSSVAVRTGNVYVATIEGCDITGKVTNGYSIVADGTDENGNEVEGYILGKGDVYVMDSDTSAFTDDEKVYLKLCADVPSTPSKGDVLIVDDTVKFFNGTKWVSQKMPTALSELTNDVGYITSEDVPTKTSQLENDSNFTTNEVLTEATKNLRDYFNIEYPYASDGDITKYGIENPVVVINNGLETYTLNQFVNSSTGSKWYENTKNYNLRTDDGYTFKFYINNTLLHEFTRDSKNLDISESWVSESNTSFELECSVAFTRLALWADTKKNVDEVEQKVDYVSSEIPTKVSELENDAKYITEDNLPSNIVTHDGDTTIKLGEDEESKSYDMTSFAKDKYAIKYDDDEHMTASIGLSGHPFQMTLAHSDTDSGKIVFGNDAYIDGNHFEFVNKDSYLAIGGGQHNADVQFGPNINIHGDTETGKSYIMIDGTRMAVVTPADTTEGQTLQAIKVIDETSTASLMSTRDAEEKSHIEWKAVDSISKTSQLTNDSGYITAEEASKTTIRTWAE